MPVILMENHAGRRWSLFRSGTVPDRATTLGKTGLAHLLEHMMFKGTPSVGGEAFTRIIHENGGEYNAFTSHDFAGYYATMAADRISVVIELEADRMRNLVLEENEFETEKQVVMEERRLRVEDNPQGLLAEQLRCRGFQVSPYRRPVIGWMDDLKRLTVEDARQYYDTYYTPSNAFIVVVGDFDTERMFNQVAAAFGGIPSGEPPHHYVYRNPRKLAKDASMCRPMPDSRPSDGLSCSQYRPSGCLCAGSDLRRAVGRQKRPPVCRAGPGAGTGAFGRRRKLLSFRRSGSVLRLGVPMRGKVSKILKPRFCSSSSA
jgi:hypothetical protein